MRKSIAFLYLLLFAAGIAGGIFFSSGTVMASDPESTADTRAGAETNASVWYDEKWKAIGALVTTPSGYASVEPHKRLDTGTAALIEKTSGKWGVTLQPKMVVTKW